MEAYWDLRTLAMRSPVWCHLSTPLDSYTHNPDNAKWRDLSILYSRSGLHQPWLNYSESPLWASALSLLGPCLILGLHWNHAATVETSSWVLKFYQSPSPWRSRPLRRSLQGRWLTRRGTQHFTRECVHYITSKGRAINHSFFPFPGRKPKSFHFSLFLLIHIIIIFGWISQSSPWHSSTVCRHSPQQSPP